MTIRYVNEVSLFKVLCYIAPNLAVFWGPLFLGHAVVVLYNVIMILSCKNKV